jgi:hypothetical protein
LVAAFAFIARLDADALRPIMDLPEGVDVYRHAMTQAALAIAAAEAGLLVLVAITAYALAHISTRLHPKRKFFSRQFLSTRISRIPSYEVRYNDDNGDPIRDNVDAQDVMAWISQGRIYDRSDEMLLTTERGIIMFRKMPNAR